MPRLVPERPEHVDEPDDPDDPEQQALDDEVAQDRETGS